jgi:hypothetical protein
MAPRKRGDQFAMKQCHPAPGHDHAAVRRVRECGDGALDLACFARVDRA